MSGAPDFAEPLEAWRVWRVVAADDGYRLGSVIKPTLWPPGEPLVADCLRTRPLVDWLRRRPRHGAPERSCACGIYAAGLDRIAEYVSEANAPRTVACVVGRVSLWGDVVECERGFRASHAYPQHIYLPQAGGRTRGARWEEVALSLADYRVPVEPLATRCEDAIRALTEVKAA